MLLNVCKTKPFNHQAKALELGHKQRVFAYFMEMGTGKTNLIQYIETGNLRFIIILKTSQIYLYGKNTTLRN